jgi:enoyl-CoA hydratase/carnithine racemase
LSVQASAANTQRVRTSPQPWGTKVELCAPARRNALDQAAVAALREVFGQDEPGAILLCAEGPVFCAGGDLEVLSRAAAAGDLADLLAGAAAAFADVIELIVSCRRPVVAAIDGPAVGGGASLALACDVRLATPRARLAFSWARHGLPPDGCATALLAGAVGPSRARALLMEGTDVGPDSALSPLLYTRVVDADRLAAVAEETTTRLAASPGARAAKAATRSLLLPPLRAQRQEELAGLARAAADPSVVAQLAMLYKIDR